MPIDLNARMRELDADAVSRYVESSFKAEGEYPIRFSVGKQALLLQNVSRFCLISSDPNIQGHGAFLQGVADRLESWIDRNQRLAMEENQSAIADYEALSRETAEAIRPIQDEVRARYTELLKEVSELEQILGTERLQMIVSDEPHRLDQSKVKDYASIWDFIGHSLPSDSSGGGLCTSGHVRVQIYETWFKALEQASAVVEEYRPLVNLLVKIGDISSQAVSLSACLSLCSDPLAYQKIAKTHRFTWCDGLPEMKEQFLRNFVQKQRAQLRISSEEISAEDCKDAEAFINNILNDPLNYLYVVGGHITNLNRWTVFYAPHQGAPLWDQLHNQLEDYCFNQWQLSNEERLEKLTIISNSLCMIELENNPREFESWHEWIQQERDFVNLRRSIASDVHQFLRDSEVAPERKFTRDATYESACRASSEGDLFKWIQTNAYFLLEKPEIEEFRAAKYILKQITQMRSSSSPVHLMVQHFSTAMSMLSGKFVTPSLVNIQEPLDPDGAKKVELWESIANLLMSSVVGLSPMRPLKDLFQLTPRSRSASPASVRLEEASPYRTYLNRLLCSGSSLLHFEGALSQLRYLPQPEDSELKAALISITARAYCANMQGELWRFTERMLDPAIFVEHGGIPDHLRERIQAVRAQLVGLPLSDDLVLINEQLTRMGTELEAILGENSRGTFGVEGFSSILSELGAWRKEKYDELQVMVEGRYFEEHANPNLSDFDDSKDNFDLGLDGLKL